MTQAGLRGIPQKETRYARRHKPDTPVPTSRADTLPDTIKSESDGGRVRAAGEKRKTGRARIRHYISAALTDSILLYFIPLLVVFSDAAAESVRESLKMLVTTLAPSLFPFLVLSALISRTGTADRIGAVIGRPFSALFGLPGTLSFALIIGLCAGYPAGAAAVCGVYKSGGCSADEAERGCALLNNTGPGLVIGLLGGALLGDSRTGAVIYISQLLAVFTLGALHGLHVRHRGRRRNEVLSSELTERESPFRAKHGTLSEVLPGAVGYALTTLLTVGSLVTVFGLLQTLIAALTAGLLPPTASLPIAMLLEITGGLRHAAGVGGIRGAVLCAAAVGWSGICVIVQTRTLMSDCGLSGERIIPSRLSLSALCALYTYFILSFTG